MEKNYTDSDEQLSPQIIAFQFCEKTTTHGVPHIYHSRSLVKRIIWVVLTIGALLLMSSHLYLLLNGYLQFNKQTNTDIVSRSYLNFPAVTICNNNMLRNSRISSQPEYQRLLNEFRASNDLSGFLKQLSARIPDLEREARLNLGHIINDTLISCKYNGMKCETKHFTYLQNHELGNCYTFNTKNTNMSDLMSVSTDSQLKSRRAGRKYGLTLELNIEQYEYISFMTEASGARVVIHSQDAMPFPEESSISVGPDSQVNIGVTEVLYERKGLPYNNCTELDDSSILNVYKHLYPVKYSKQACLNTCLQARVLQECGCFIIEVPYVNGAYEDEATKSCTYSQQMETCSEDVRQEYSDGGFNCADCFDSCREHRYETAVTATTWPSPKYIPDYMMYVADSHPIVKRVLNTYYSGLPTIEQAVRENFLQVNIYFDELSTRTVVESAQYDDYQFASDLGGTFGLWCGWSFFTIFELFELIVDIIVYFCMSRCSYDTSVHKISPSKMVDVKSSERL